MIVIDRIMLKGISGLRIWHVALFNLLGILIMFLYEVMSLKGENIEATWTILFVTGAISVVLVVISAVHAIRQKRLVWYEPALALLILTVNALELFLLQGFWQMLGL